RDSGRRARTSRASSAARRRTFAFGLARGPPAVGTRVALRESMTSRRSSRRSNEGGPMLSRMLAIVISSWLPVMALILPMSAVHRASALVSGIVATVLAAFSLVDNRARYGAALVGAWVAVSPFLILGSTLLEKVVTVSWGVTMFTWLA